MEASEQTQLGDHIRRQRNRLGLTQRQLAERLGVTVKTVHNWEHGHARPGLLQGLKMAKFRKRFGNPATGDFPNRLHVARRLLGLSQADFGARIGVSKDTIWGWESGRHEPRAHSRNAADRMIELAFNEDEMMAARVKALRKSLKLTQRELAERLGVYTKTVSRWERGKRRPSEAMLRQVEEMGQLGLARFGTSN